MSKSPLQYQTYQPNRQSLSQVKPARKPPVYLLALAIIGGLALGIYGLMSLVGGLAHNSVAETALAQTLTKPSPSATPIPAGLEQKLSAIIAANPNTQIGVALENISTGETKTYGINAPFEAASTAKLITACAYYHLVETGQASLSAPMGSYDASFQIKAMVNQSSNDSWDMLVGAISQVGLESYAQSIGVDYRVDGNTLSPASMATLLSKLYSGKLLNKTDTNQLLSYMQDTNDDSLIPAALNSTITVYHKYGLLNGELHDAAILDNGTQSYALVIYTKGTDDSDDTARTTMIHNLTSTVSSAVYAG